MENQKVLVTYQSKTGFTKKYAEWIKEELNCDMKEIKEVKPEDVAAYDLIIHGGWLMAGMISGLEKIRGMNPKKLVVFGVGFTKKGEKDAEVIEANKLGDTPFFYMEGGTNPEKMGFFAKFVMKTVTKKPVVFMDNTDKKYAMELVKSVRGM